MSAWLRFARRSYDVVGWSWCADVYCPGCARKAWGDPDGAVDSEGNPVGPVFADMLEGGEVCGSCGGPL